MATEHDCSGSKSERVCAKRSGVFGGLSPECVVMCTAFNILEVYIMCRPELCVGS